MKTVAIFNEKGGTGKSTLTALMASWLTYSQGEKVSVLDFDGPSYQFASWRKKELRYAQTEGCAMRSLASSEPFGVAQVPKLDSGRMKLLVSRMAAREDGYLFLEFGGSFREGDDDPSFVLLTSGLVDRLIIPVTADSQTVDAAMYTVMTLRTFARKGVRIPGITVLWNNVSGNDRRADGKHDIFSVAEVHFRALGADICPLKGRRHEILGRDADWPFFVRNTLCWPEKHVRFLQMEWLEELLRELRSEIDDTQHKSNIYTSKDK